MADAVKVAGLRCEYLTDPLGIDIARPRLSWVLESSERGQKQTACRVLVASSADRLAKDEGDLWDSGKVAGDTSIHVPYNGKELASYQPCHWKVRVWDRDEQPSAWSDPAHWTMGILDPGLWKGKWLGYSKPYDHDTGWAQKAPSPVFRKAFAIDGPIRSATLSIAGLGYYVASLNGMRVGDHVLDPSFTRYDKRVLYVTYDVSDLLRPGKNAIGVMLGNGFYNSHTRDAWDFDQAPWRDAPKLLAQIRVVLADGTERIIGTDGSWKASTGPVVLDGIRNGQVYDARLEMPGWDTADYDDASWAAPAIVAAPRGTLRAQMHPAIKVFESIRPVKISETKPGVWLFDMGQNFAGWARLKVHGPAGTKVEMLYSERANPDGSIDRKDIDKFVKTGPFQTDAYILKGQGEETSESLFSYHGFRWVEVHGLPGKPAEDTLTGRVVHTAFDEIGRFECSNDLLNTIQKLTLWSYRSNFEGIPTDCPQREKNGWTGDAHLAAEQAMFNFENSAGYTKWIHDLADEQQPDGNLPGIVPTSGWGYKWGNGPAWDSAYILIPWYLYQYRGDTRILEENYEGFKKYVDCMTSKAKDGLVSHGLGDWVPAKTETPVVVTSTGYYYQDARIVSMVATILDRPEDDRKYGELADRIRESFRKQVMKPGGHVANDSQTALSCAVFQRLAAREDRPAIVGLLADRVASANDHLDTGILGAKYLFRTLSENGKHELAYRIACQTTAPSYGDWIRRGATTLWEDWGDGASRNHIMFGDISAWFQEYLAGIQPDARDPGFKLVRIRPRPVGDLTWAKGETRSMYGRIASSWRREGETFTLDVTIPPNSTATVFIPARGGADSVTEDGRPLSQSPGVTFDHLQDDTVVVAVQSGTYHFRAK
jgi:alpha-L-rhamnosidase